MSLRSILWLLPLVVGLAAAADSEIKVQVSIPKALSGQAVRRLAGDAGVASPVLMLEGVRTLTNQGFTIEILAQGKDGAGNEKSVLAVTGVVARQPADTPDPKTEKVDIPVPLNEKSAALLANRSAITLILRTDNETSLKLDRAYFREAK